MTRWYTVGLAAKAVIEQWDRLKEVSVKICNAYNTDTAPSKCASALFSLLNEPGLKAHVAWIYWYHEAWWNKRFLWLQAVDPRTKIAGFRSHHMAVFYFSVTSDLIDLSTN